MKAMGFVIDVSPPAATDGAGEGQEGLGPLGRADDVGLRHET
jgi:hypothetical protein